MREFCQRENYGCGRVRDTYRPALRACNCSGLIEWHVPYFDCCNSYTDRQDHSSLPISNRNYASLCRIQGIPGRYDRDEKSS